MNQQTKDYSEALFMLAKEQGKEKEYAQALELLCSLFEEYPDYAELLSAPNLPLQERLALGREAFADALPEELLSFMELLCRTGHLKAIAQCRADYNELLREDQRITRARVLSAAPLTEEQQKKLLQKLEKISGRKVEATFATDPTLLGGFTVDMDGTVLDSSLRRQMRNIKEVIRS